jgi:hypothetical protein
MQSTPPDRYLLRLPALQAFAIQCASLVILYVLLRFIWSRTGVPVTLVMAALLQGVIAAALSRWRGLASWWLFIQLLFPGALLATHALRLPPVIFLVAFMLLVGLYWTAFRTQVPLYLSGPTVWNSVASLLPQERPIRFIDIGSGLGGLVLNLALRRPESSFAGIEVAPLPWLASWLRARFLHSSACFIRGDYCKLNFAEYDVVFAYLSPAVMQALREKAQAEMRPGALLLSYEFPFPGMTPDIVVRTAPDGSVLYGWYKVD